LGSSPKWREPTRNGRVVDVVVVMSEHIHAVFRIGFPEDRAGIANGPRRSSAPTEFSEIVRRFKAFTATRDFRDRRFGVRPERGGRREVIALIPEGAIAVRILAHLKLPVEVEGFLPIRAPPWDPSFEAMLAVNDDYVDDAPRICRSSTTKPRRGGSRTRTRTCGLANAGRGRTGVRFCWKNEQFQTLTRRSGGVDWAAVVEFGEAAITEVGCGRRVHPGEGLGALIRCGECCWTGAGRVGVAPLFTRSFSVTLAKTCFRAVTGTRQRCHRTAFCRRSRRRRNAGRIRPPVVDSECQRWPTKPRRRACGGIRPSKCDSGTWRWFWTSAVRVRSKRPLATRGDVLGLQRAQSRLHRFWPGSRPLPQRFAFQQRCWAYADRYRRFLVHPPFCAGFWSDGRVSFWRRCCRRIGWLGSVRARRADHEVESAAGWSGFLTRASGFRPVAGRSLALERSGIFERLARAKFVGSSCTPCTTGSTYAAAVGGSCAHQKGPSSTSCTPNAATDDATSSALGCSVSSSPGWNVMTGVLCCRQ
jgi:hypothetical protein